MTAMWKALFWISAIANQVNCVALAYDHDMKGACLSAVFAIASTMAACELREAK
ncbi:hypothetical protein [Herbaspirillum aquaticum]|uniref:hypothetical protein n=1 Tax=Herbaspirillum aquaticum TaxID=568783 RepID=UPI0024DE59BC|nr:hypothetical protein [Herbaspirillum aquaticum]